MNVLSFDPGGVTGVAWYIDGEFGGTEIPGGFDGYYDWSQPFAVWSKLPPILDKLHIVTYESFTVNARTHKLDPTAYEDTTSIIGCIRRDARSVEAQIFRQSPGEAKGFSTNDKLKQAGFWTPTSGGHANDAARHLLVRLFKLRDPGVLGLFK